ncbi:MAG: hypothetical protein ACFNW0_02195, partial [Fretibacterium sp.]
SYGFPNSLWASISRQAVPQQAIRPFVSPHKLKYYTISRKISFLMTKNFLPHKRFLVCGVILVHYRITGRDAKLSIGGASIEKP